MAAPIFRKSTKGNTILRLTIRAGLLAFFILTLFQVVWHARPKQAELPTSIPGQDNKASVAPSIPPVEHHEAIANHQFQKPFPRRIWQTSQQLLSDLNEDERILLRSWRVQNPDWRFESITRETADSFLDEAFPSGDKIVETFRSLETSILRADIIRYLLLLKHGGLYSDADTLALKPIKDWIPAEYQSKANIVVGVEYDALDSARWVDWTMDLQFTTWTILAKPEHPLLKMTVEWAMKGLKVLAVEQGTSIAKVNPSFYQILETTGPAMFSRATFAYITQQLKEPFTWKNVTGLQQPLLVADVLILPITAFGCNQAHSNAGNPDDPGAYVQHMFRGSWKVEHTLADELKKADAERGQKTGKEEDPVKED